jgi:hypothetical protein
MPSPWAQGARVRILGKIQNQDYVNVLHFATNTQINDPQELATLLVALATAILACLHDNLLQAATQDFRLLGVEAATIFPQPSDPIFVAEPAPGLGQQSASSTSFEASQINIRTGIGGRKGRGRNFWPPVGENQTNDSTIGALAVESFQDMITCILGKFVGAGATEDWRLGVLSRKDMGTPPVAGNFDNAFREAISMDLVTNVALMGSRKRGRGN